MKTVIITAILQGNVWVVQNEHGMPETWDSMDAAAEWVNSSPNTIFASAGVVTVVDVASGETQECTLI